MRVRGCMRSDGAELARQPQLTKRKRKGREADGSAGCLSLAFLPKSLVRAATELEVSALPHQTGREPYEIFRTTALDEKREGKVW